MRLSLLLFSALGWAISIGTVGFYIVYFALMSLGVDVLLYERNLWIARAELAVWVLGLSALLYLFRRWYVLERQAMSKPKK